MKAASIVAVDTKEVELKDVDIAEIGVCPAM
jgi:hypothetical protein